MTPRRSLRAQLALHALAISVVATALGLAGLLPLWRIGDEAIGSGELALVVIAAGAVLVFAVSYFFLVRWIAGPAEALLAATERVGAGLDAPLLSDAGPALGRLGTAFARMEARLAEERARVRRQVAELQAMNVELRAARDTAIRQEKLASVGRLAAGVAHEIGNPVSAILGYLELLKAEGSAPPEYVERIDKELERIDRIVRDLLDYAKPRGTDPQPVKVVDVVERVLRLARPQPRFREVRLDLEDEAPGAIARADEHYLGQAILNLLQNAADAMEGKGTIRVVLQAEDERAVLRVVDQGPGIPPADLPRLFDPFFTTKAPGQGTGLGLSLCQGWIEAMGGSLRASNLPEGGAELRIDLPLVRG
ncbi:MAG TPA: ATP-binding protein [Vulgatibacter sp.]|nr:ATP-binding protein [Vulgatibacter sp.]